MNYHAKKCIPEAIVPNTILLISRNTFLHLRGYSHDVKTIRIEELRPIGLPSDVACERRGTERTVPVSKLDETRPLWSPPTPSFFFNANASEFIPQLPPCLSDEYEWLQCDWQSLMGTCDEDDACGGHEPVWKHTAQVISPPDVSRSSAIEFGSETEQKIQSVSDPFWLSVEEAYRQVEGRSWTPYEEVDWHSVDITANVKVVQTSCCRCGAMEVDCFCQELYCRRCFSVADRCSCQDPWVRVRICAECMAPESCYGDIFSKFDIPTPASDQFLCPECGSDKCRVPSSQDDIIQEMYTLGGARVCHECGRVDRQDNIMCCEGRTCLSMFHDSCRPVVLEGRRFCADCIAVGNPPSDDEDSSDISGEDAEEDSSDED